MAVDISGNSLWWQTRVDNKRLATDTKQTKRIFGDLSKSISKAAIFSSVGIAAGLAIREIVKVNVQFEKSISVLSSLTGAVGEDLDFFKEKAIEFGESTTQSATQVADAFKLIGSQKPELLLSREALAEVTKEAITLAEASQVDATQAAKALTLSLNQMGVGAEKSSEFINILAAGSKKGAGDIPFLNAAIEKTGKVAKDANLSFAEMVSVIEQLAPAISEPSSAGLHMQQVLLRLQKAGFGFSTGMFDLQEALHEVQDELDGIVDPSERASREIDIFGTRSITAGKVMLETKDKFKEFAGEISNTNTAYEQAIINTDNVQGSFTRLKSATEGVMLRLGQSGGLNDLLKNTIDLGTEFMQTFSTLIEVMNQLKPESEKAGEGMKKLRSVLLSLIAPIRGLIKYNTILVNGLKDALEFLGLIEDDADRRMEKIQSRVKELQEEFNKLSIKEKEGIIGDFEDLNEQFKKDRDIIKYFNALNNLISATRKVEDTSFTITPIIEETEKVTDKALTPYEKALKEFDLIQDLKKSEVELIIQSEIEKELMLNNLAIRRLTFIRDFNTELEDIQKQTLDNQIDLLNKQNEKLLDSIETYSTVSAEASDIANKQTDEQIKKARQLEIAFGAIGDVIEGTFKDGEISVKNFASTLRDVTIEIISLYIGQALAAVVADSFKKFGIKALVLAPIFAGATKALLGAIIPKFAKGKPADYTGGGVVDGTGNSDSQIGMFTPNEMVLNGKQQANILWKIANSSFGSNKIEGLLTEQNKLLKNAKTVIMKDDIMHVVINGQLTGERTLL